MPYERPKQRSSDHCTFCNHSVEMHGEAGCRAFSAGTAIRAPRPCDCERDGLAAERASAPRARHLTVVK
jgi:hypothetical protein